MKDNSKRILKYLIEFLIVAFGVFLGIYVSEWRSQNKMAANVEKSMKYIVEEMESNRDNLEKTIAYHEMIKVNFDSLRRTLSMEDIMQPYFGNDKFRHQQIKGWTGIGLSNFEDIAYESAKISGTIQEIDIELIHLISKMYKQQDFNTEFGKTTLSQMLDMDSNAKVLDVINVIELLTTDVLNNEKHVLKNLNKTIERFSSRDD